MDWGYQALCRMYGNALEARSVVQIVWAPRKHETTSLLNEESGPGAFFAETFWSYRRQLVLTLPESVAIFLPGLAKCRDEM
jgi:hypothetical protein